MKGLHYLNVLFAMTILVSCKSIHTKFLPDWIPYYSDSSFNITMYYKPESIFFVENQVNLRKVAVSSNNRLYKNNNLDYNFEYEIVLFNCEDKLISREKTIISFIDNFYKETIIHEYPKNPSEFFSARKDDLVLLHIVCDQSR